MLSLVLLTLTLHVLRHVHLVVYSTPPDILHDFAPGVLKVVVPVPERRV